MVGENIEILSRFSNKEIMQNCQVQNNLPNSSFINKENVVAAMSIIAMQKNKIR